MKNYQRKKSQVWKSQFLQWSTISAVCGLLVLFAGSCRTVPKPIKNSLAYFNTYYNANRLMIEAEDEFFYFDEKQRTKPRILILAEPTLPDDAPDVFDVPRFAKAMIIPKEKLAPVQNRVDSIIIKGSKILSRHAESDLVDGTLFLMAKAYFYKSDWFQAQVKCQELMDNFPYSVLSPDAHLLMAKTLLMQAKFTQADKALLKAIDISWGQHRYDALSEAFRIQAEIALHFGNTEDAVKPYRRAITQADDISQQSRWQLEIGLLYYRQKKFTEAITELQKVLWYSPDALTRYEAELYTAAATARLKGMKAAQPLFNNILANQSVREWRAFAYGELITSMRYNGIGEGIDSLYAIADTMKTPEAVAAARYQGGLEMFNQREFRGALSFFAKSQVEAMPAYFYAQKYLNFLTDWQSVAAEADEKLRFFNKVKDDTATFTHPNQLPARSSAAGVMYRAGRIFERLGVPDSAIKYYQAAAWLAPSPDTNRARYLYAEAALLGMERRGLKPIAKLLTNIEAPRTDSLSAGAGGRTINPGNALLMRLREWNNLPVPIRHIDSLLKIVAYTYSTTEQGRDARIRLGLTQEAIRDTALDWMISADSYRATKKYDDALKQYAAVVERYPDTRHAPRALYAQGWLYENSLKNLDSAIRYYSTLVDKYPASQSAIDIKPSLDAALEARHLQDSVRAAALQTKMSTMASMKLSTQANTTLATTSATLNVSTTGTQRRRR